MNQIRQQKLIIKYFLLSYIIIILGFLPFSFAQTDPEVSFSILVNLIVGYCENAYHSEEQIDVCILNEFYFQHIIDYYKFLIENQHS